MVGATTVAVDSVVVPVPFVAVFVPSVVFVPPAYFENEVLHRAWMND